MKKTLLISTLGIAAALCSVGAANAQVAGSTTLGVAVTEANLVAMGWSAKKSILGKSVYTEGGVKIGKVDDLIIAPDKNVSYLIVGAGGFIGVGRHDVAVPVTQIRQQGGKLVMAGATKDSLKAMPPFDYTPDTAARDKFVAATEQDIAKAKEAVAELEKKAAAAAGDAKVKLDQQNAALKLDLKAAEDKFAELKRAGASRWKEFEADTSAALARLRKSLEKSKA
jgi:sporulation protein YlmC with PRC-barrel domain